MSAAEQVAPQGALSRPNPHAARYSQAVRHAVQAAPHLAVMAMSSIPQLPVRLRCSQNIRTLSPTRSTSLLWIDQALDCPWLSWDAEEIRNTILIDIDHADALARWQDLPPHIRPHLVMSAWSGRAHAILPLASPVCITAKGREGPRILADLAGRLLAAALGGTLLPVRSVVKNPWGLSSELIGHLPRLGPVPQFPELHEASQVRGLVWHTVPGSGPCELKSIIEALAPQYWHEPAAQKPGKPWQKKHRESCPLGRNVLLFDSVRFWAYDRVERDLAAITAEAVRVNAAFSIPLPSGEVHATARSIAKFMASRYRPRMGINAKVKRGRDAVAISEDMPLEARQAIAGSQTAQARTAATLAKLFDAAAGLSQDGKRPTQAALANISGISERRVREVWNIPARNRSYGALSGNGPRQGRPTPNLREYCESLWSDVQRKKRDSEIIQAYQTQAERMMKKGARPEVVLPRGDTLNPEIHRAHEKAMAARRDANRRQEARQERRETQVRVAERKANFRAWSEANDVDAFKAFYRKEEARWDAMERFIDPAEKWEMRRHRERMGAYLKRLRQEWAEERARVLWRPEAFW